jgi:iron(III) transport system substrate-binding protein
MLSVKRTSKLLATLLCMAVVVSACGGKSSGSATSATAGDAANISPAWAATLEAANKEGVVRMYSTLVPAINTDLEKAFHKAYPKIDLQITRVVGEDVSAKLDAERTTGADGADIVDHINFPWMFDPTHASYFVKPTGPDATGPTWEGTDNLVDGVFQLSVLTALGISWNTDLDKTAPKGYQDLLSPDLANGKIGLVDNVSSSSADLYAWLTDKFGPDYLTKLAAQKPKFYASAVPLQQALLSGEVAVGVWGANAIVQPEKAKGAPIDFTLGDPAWSTVNYTYMLKWAKHPNAAQVLFNFMASPAGQAVLGKGNISSQKDVPGTLATPDKVTPLNVKRTLQPGWVAANQAAWRKTFGR